MREFDGKGRWRGSTRPPAPVRDPGAAPRRSSIPAPESPGVRLDQMEMAAMRAQIAGLRELVGEMQAKLERADSDQADQELLGRMMAHVSVLESRSQSWEARARAAEAAVADRDRTIEQLRGERDEALARASHVASERKGA
jgi:hypothetical protein